MEKQLQDIYAKLGEILEEEKKRNRESLSHKDVFESDPVKLDGHILQGKDEYLKECYLTFLALLFAEKITEEKLRKFRLVVDSVTDLTSDYFIVKARGLDSKGLKDILIVLDSQETKESLLLDMLIVSSITEETEQLSKMVQVLKIEKEMLEDICDLAKNILEENRERLIKSPDRTKAIFYCNLFFDEVYFAKEYTMFDLGYRAKKIVLNSRLRKAWIKGAMSQLSIKNCEILGKLEVHSSLSIDVEKSHFKKIFNTAQEISEDLLNFLSSNSEKSSGYTFGSNLGGAMWGGYSQKHEDTLKKELLVKVKSEMKTKRFDQNLRENKRKVIKKLFFSSDIQNLRIDEESQLTIEFQGNSITI